MVRRLAGWAWAAVMAHLVLAACRAHVDVCEDTDCEAVESGRGGTAGQPADGASGAEPECRRDRDCDDGLLCDGTELCRTGVCVPGDPITCEHGTACTEAGADRCVYARESPWLVTLGFSSLRAAPAAALTAGEELLLVRERPRDGLAGQGFEHLQWVPGKNVGLVFSAEEQFGSRIELLRVGPGAASSLSPIFNVPTWGYFRDGVDFSRDGTRAALVDYYTGTYLIDLRVDPELPQLLSDQSLGIHFCGDGHTWLERNYEGDVLQLATTAEGEVSRQDLGVGVPSLSADGQLIVIDRNDEWQTDDPELGVTIVACAPNAWTLEIPEAAEAWMSSDSRRLLVEGANGGLRLLSLEDPQAPAEVWAKSGVVAFDDAPFVGTDGLLMLASANDDTLLFVDASEGPEAVPQRLGLPAGAEVEEVTDGGTLVWLSHDDDEGRDLYWQGFPPLAEPTHVFGIGAEEGGDWHHIYGIPGAGLFERRVDDHSVLTMVRIGDAGPEVTPLGEIAEDIYSVDGAGDGSGLAVMTSGAALLDTRVYWIPFVDGIAGSPRHIADSVVATSFAP